MSQNEVLSTAAGDALSAAMAIADAACVDRGAQLLAFKAALDAGADMNHRGPGGLRAVDFLAKGLDSYDAAAAVELIATAGHAELMMKAPTPSDMPPMFAACYAGNPVIVNCLLELGMPADVKGNAPAIRLLKGTPFHAAVLGFRGATADDHAQCIGLLCGYAPQGIDAPDRLGQRPVDLAFMLAAEMRNTDLIDALMSFGVQMNGDNTASAARMAQAMLRTGRHQDLHARLAQCEAKLAVREISGLAEPADKPRSMRP